MDKVVELLIVLAVVVGMTGLLAVPYGLYQERQRYTRLMEQCLSDHKEYECVLMMR